MCGIAGLFTPEVPVETNIQRLGRMLDLIVHRGPDGQGMHVEPNGLAIGMRRLSVVDLATGWQPIWNEDRTIGVVFNGEIYNYVELTKELRQRAHSFATNSDTEVLVHLYEEMGERMLEKLRGMFSFALFDRNRQRLFLARDHLGQKPLYYWISGRRFAFASELKCLLSLQEVGRNLDPTAFLDYISWFSLPSPATHFKSIRKLPPGSSLTLDLTSASEPVVTRYWKYEVRDAPRFVEMNEAVEVLDSALEDSVRLHFRSDVPVGLLLSGGLDSRAVGAYAKAVQGSGFSTFSVGFDCGESELADAAATAKEIGSSHFTLEISANKFGDDLDRVAWHLDEPIGDPAAVAILNVCELARSEVKVLLSGEGADEIFGGYAERYRGMLQTMDRTERLRPFAAFLPRPHHVGSPSRLQRWGDRVHKSRGAEAVAMRMEGFPGDIRNPRGLTQAQRHRQYDRQTALAERLYHPQRDRLSELLALDMEWQLAESLLQKADKMSMAASIELRTPLLDREIASIAARMDSSLKLRATGAGKLVLRQCVNRRLPETFMRPKKGFPVPLAEWFRGPLKGQLTEEVFNLDAKWRDHLDADLVSQAWNDFQQGSWTNAQVFYALWVHEKWRRSLLDKRLKAI